MRPDPPPAPLPPPDILAKFEFKCRRCGRCCGLTPFTRADYKRIRRRAEKLRITFVKESVEGHTVYFVKRIAGKVKQAGSIEKVDGKDLTCPFMQIDADKKTACVIYDERPELCRKFGNEGWRGVSLCCPYQDLTGETGSA